MSFLQLLNVDIPSYILLERSFMVMPSTCTGVRKINNHVTRLSGFVHTLRLLWRRWICRRRLLMERSSMTKWRLKSTKRLKKIHNSFVVFTVVRAFVL